MLRKADNDIFTGLIMIDIDENKKPWPFLSMHLEAKMLNTEGKENRGSHNILYNIQNLVKQRHLNPHLLGYFFPPLFKGNIALIKKDNSN